MKKRFSLPILLAFMAPAVAGQLEVSHAWVRASLPGQSVASGFAVLRNPLDHTLRLREIHSKAAKTVELHSHAMVDGQMRMRRIEAFSIPAGGEAIFRPGENHIMLMGLERPLRAGDKVSIDLCFEEVCAKMDLPVVDIMDEAAYRQ